MPEITRENVSIYTETLFNLARDAWLQGQPEAYFFTRGYLVGLVPSAALDAFEQALGAIPAAPKPKPVKLDDGGGATVTNPTPKPSVPPAPVKAPEPFRVRESATLQW